MYLLIFILSLKQANVKASVTTSLAELTSFGFLKDGTYSVSIIDSTQPVICGLLTETEFKSYRKAEGLTKEEYCPINESQPLKKFSDNQIFYNVSHPSETFNGIVDHKDIYLIFLYSCGSEKYTIKYSMEFSNPDTKLDYRQFPSLIEYPVSVGVFAVLLIVWLINWFMNLRLKILIHYILTAVFILAVIESAARYGVLSYSAKNHSNRGVESIYIVFNVLFLAAVFIFIVLAAKGWCIVRESLKFSELALAITFTICFIILQTIYNYVSFGKYDIIVIILMLVFLVLYVHQLITAINSATLHIRAHLLAISNAGIDSKTTPVWQKYQMYQFLQWNIIIFLLFLIIHIIVVYFLPGLIWLDGFLNDIQNILILVLLGINFRLRGPDASNGYAMIEDPNYTEYALSDIEGIDLNTELNRGGRQWEAGMPLPGPPQIVQAPSIITLESPDGTAEIVVQPGSYQE